MKKDNYSFEALIRKALKNHTIYLPQRDVYEINQENVDGLIASLKYAIEAYSNLVDISNKELKGKRNG